MAESDIERTAAWLADAACRIARVLPDEVVEDRTGKEDQPQQANRNIRRAEPNLLTRIEKRNRKQLIPHYITAGLAGLAEAIHALSVQVQAVGTAALITGLAAGAAGAGGYLLLRQRKMLLDGWAMWSALLASATALWMVTAVLAGVDWDTVAAALAAEYAFGARWWARHRHPYPEDAQLDEVIEGEIVEPVHIDPSLIATYPRRWAETLGCRSGILAGSMLVDGQRFDHGIEYTLKLVGGRQDLATVLGVLPKVASGLQHPASRLIAEPILSDGEEENPSLVRLSVITASPVKAGVFFREPVVRDGYIPIGPYIDGRGMATYRLYTRSRIQNGLVVGSPGTGKSRLLEIIGLVAMWTGYTKVIHIDGQNGESCPLLWDNVEHYGRDEADLALARLQAMQRHRETNKPPHLRGKFRPSPDYPGVLVIIDEAHLIITRGNKEGWKSLCREGNKIGMGYLCADQDPSVQTWHDAALRSFLKAGNGIGLRVDDATVSRIASTGPDAFDLNCLPRRPGVGYVMKSDHPDARQATYQGLWAPDQDDAYPLSEAGERATERQIPDDVVLIEEWYARAPKIQLDAGTAMARDRAKHARVTASEQPGKAHLVAVPLPTVAAPVFGESEVRVLEAVREGVAQPGAIAELVGLTRQQVGNHLRALTDKGLVTKSGAGPAVRYITAESRESA
jgi:hypothetical protein